MRTFVHYCIQLNKYTETYDEIIQVNSISFIGIALFLYQRTSQAILHGTNRVQGITDICSNVVLCALARFFFVLYSIVINANE